MNVSFQQLGLQKELISAMAMEGILQPTPIQVSTIPSILAGKDVMAKAETGSGKSLAFLLPVLQRLDFSKKGIQALVLAPTRELAIQLSGEIRKLAPAYPFLEFETVYGGQNIEREIQNLSEKPPAVVVATPGRLLDHIRRETIDLKEASVVVLDEMDQLLHFGFLEEVKAVIHELPSEKQMLLFSATFNNQVQRIASEFMNNPEDIREEEKMAGVSSIKQVVIETGRISKQTVLMHTLKQFHPYLSIIFCRTRGRVDFLHNALIQKGFSTAALHGGMSQTKRETAMEALRQHKVSMLVATDVAARGVDIPELSHVFNFDIPFDADEYTHRIGRTGRAGAAGLAVTLVTPRDQAAFSKIEKKLGGKLKRTTLNIES